MINHNNEAVLIDFGVSALVDKQEDDQLNDNLGSYLFFAPEMFQDKKTKVKIRGEKTDIWALGVTLFYMLTGSYPSGDITDLQDLGKHILYGEIDFSIIKNLKARKVVESMLVKNAEKRASLTELL